MAGCVRQLINPQSLPLQPPSHLMQELLHPETNPRQRPNSKVRLAMENNAPICDMPPNDGVALLTVSDLAGTEVPKGSHVAELIAILRNPPHGF